MDKIHFYQTVIQQPFAYFGGILYSVPAIYWVDVLDVMAYVSYDAGLSLGWQWCYREWGTFMQGYEA